MSENLESLYVEALSALKRREYDCAAVLLTQIIAVDENYKDVSRLLAQAVRLKRRRWYNHPALWIMIIIAVVVGLGTQILPKLATQPAQETSAPVALPISSPATTMISTPTNIPTITPSPMPTAIPLTWKRISMGQDFQRDSVIAFATDKNDPDVIYAGMRNSGVYKTIDGGLSWFPSHKGLESVQVLSLEIDSQNPQILYAGTMGGIFKTEDGGENWIQIGDGNYLLMDAQNNSHLYARDENFIYETKDQGNTWVSVYALKKECPDEIASWAIHPKNGNMLFIGGGQKCVGVYQSNDGGRNWSLISLEDKPNISGLAIGLDENGNYSIYVDFISPTLGELTGLYVSYDGGANWLRAYDRSCTVLIVDSDKPSETYCNNIVSRYKGDRWKMILFPNMYSVAVSALHVDHPNGKDRIIASVMNRANNDNVISNFVSTDNGASWVERNSGLGLSRSELKIDPVDRFRLYASTYYIQWGGRWIYRSMPQELTECTLYRSLDSGKNWSSITKTGNWCGPIFDATNAFYLIQSGSLQKSWDGGENWLWGYKRVGTSYDQRKADAATATKIANKLPGESQSVSANPYVDNHIYAVGDVVYYSIDAGSSWQQSTGSEGSWDARLFYTDQSKIIFDIGRYHQKYSTDNGKTWQPCGTNVTTSRSDTRLALDLQGERLYLATPGGGVLVSTDKCNSWQPSNNGLTNLHVNTLAFDPNNANIVYAGTDGGAYISYDAGATWGQVNDGLLGATVVYSIVVDKDGKVYAATPYGVFTLEKK